MAKAKTDEKVMKLVEKELEKNPDASVDELFEKASKAEKSVEKLTKRQFNARYPLQVKRRKGAKKKRKKRRSGAGRKKQKTRTTRTAAKGSDTPTANREAVRSTFMKFASDMASAQERKDLVKFLAGVDGYVDEVMKVAAG